MLLRGEFSISRIYQAEAEPKLEEGSALSERDSIFLHLHQPLSAGPTWIFRAGTGFGYGAARGYLGLSAHGFSNNPVPKTKAIGVCSREVSW